MIAPLCEIDVIISTSNESQSASYIANHCKSKVVVAEDFNQVLISCHFSV
jgi:hypothetical protein